jgi:hypothetical protein
MGIARAFSTHGLRAGLTAWLRSVRQRSFPAVSSSRTTLPVVATTRDPSRVTRKGGRYLVDQNGTPFLIAGESPQALMVNLSEEDAELFFANRRSHGFNTVWINLLCRPGTGGRADGST